MPRGGRRSGRVGQSYPNRSDLNGMPATPFVGQTYGTAAAQQASQQAVPMAPAPPPGSAGPFSRPSERPSEPITAGLPIGAGPGPEALGIGPAADPDLAQLAAYLPTLELLSTLPTASVTTRNFVRQLRALVPPETRGQGRV